MASPFTPEMIDRLVAEARVAQKSTYSPYSKFPVGAAILTESGRIVHGCNVENASYGLTICAERTAMTRCVVEQAGRPVAVAVVGDTDSPLTPCGACRQFLSEFNIGMLVVCEGRTGRRFQTTMDKLLPGAFDSAALDEAR